MRQLLNAFFLSLTDVQTDSSQERNKTTTLASGERQSKVGEGGKPDPRHIRKKEEKYKKAQ